MEERIRKYAKGHNTNFVVYAGSYNVAKLCDENGRKSQIFLSTDSHHNQAMPVPEQLYRFVYDQNMNYEIVFFRINIRPIDRNLDILKASDLSRCVCERTMSLFTGWYRMNVTKGYVYCCTLNDFLSSSGLKSAIPVKSLSLLK